jgi:hypothetical protein
MLATARARLHPVSQVRQGHCAQAGRRRGEPSRGTRLECLDCGEQRQRPAVELPIRRALTTAAGRFRGELSGYLRANRAQRGPGGRLFVDPLPLSEGQLVSAGGGCPAPPGAILYHSRDVRSSLGAALLHEACEGRATGSGRRPNDLDPTAFPARSAHHTGSTTPDLRPPAMRTCGASSDGGSRSRAGLSFLAVSASFLGSTWSQSFLQTAAGTASRPPPNLQAGA